MIWLQRLGWLSVAIITVAVVVGSFTFKLPEPQADFVIDRGLLFVGGEPGREVTLPLRSTPEADTGDPPRFVAKFDMPSVRESNLFLFIAAPNRHLRLTLNESLLFDSMTFAGWVGPVIGSPILLRLPSPPLLTGHNELSVQLQGGNYFVSLYLPEIYLGSEAELGPSFRLHLWLNERLKTIALGVQVLLGLGIILAYCCRRQDPLFSWLAGMMAVTFPTSLGTFVGFSPDLIPVLPYAMALTPALGLLAIGVACVVSGLRVPRIAGVLAFALPGACIVLMLVGLMPTRTVPALVAVPVTITSMMIATGVLVWGALQRDATPARVMLAPYVLLTAFMTRDLCAGIGLLPGPIIAITPFARPIFLVGVFGLLMGRLVSSLDRLDTANADLNHRLREREAELAVLHRAEQAEAAQLAREQERMRLTHDLHDGISGHLVSIIAMTERPGHPSDPVEQAARQALDDLRLVIYSLDLGEQDLPLALANFRERLIPQLRRAGVELDWSTADLPEVSGVTPSNALSILRILQEALTNALKHGPARKITIRGSPSPGGVALTVENDPRPFVETDRGHGLENMRRRAAELHGELTIAALDHGTRLTLELSLCLPNVPDAAANEASSAPPATPRQRVTRSDEHIWSPK